MLGLSRAAGALLALSLLAHPGAAAAAGKLVVNADAAEPEKRATWAAVVADFEAAHPGVDVELNIYDRESYKKSIRNWLSSQAPDVVFWYVGNRMRQFVEPGLLEDVSGVMTPEVEAELAPAGLELVTVDGKRYGVPYTYYQWGLFYRRDLLERAGLPAAPATWAGLLDACGKLKAAGVAPIAIGSKDLWPTAGWFDYINLRQNGLEFHNRLMAGEVPYTDPKVKAIFDRWAELLEAGCFVENHASVSWQESQALLYQGRAAMMLIGNFITPNFPADVRDRMAFAPFPTIDPGIASFEEAPMDSLHVPARARNKEDAKLFLAYVARADVQEKIAKGVLLIPVNTKAAVADDPFLRAGRALLDGAPGLSQFFDRDTDEALATQGMKGFQEFMVHPDRADRVLEALERTRKRVYGS